MTTPEQQKLAVRKITHWIENERKIVTYRDISREVGCHVNLAKNLLLEYQTSHPSVSATYLLTGPLLSTSTLNQTQLLSLQPKLGDPSLTQKVRIVDMDEMSEGDRNSEDEREEDEIGFEEVGNDKGAEDGLAGNLGIGIVGGKSGEEGEGLRGEDVVRWGVVLVGQDELEEKKKLFEAETLNIHIHSLAPAPISDPAQYLISNLTLREHPNYHNPSVYGTISGDAFKPNVTGAASVGQDKKTMKDGSMDWSGAKKVVGGKKVEEKKADVTKPEAKKSFFGSSTAAKATTTTSTSEAVAEPSKADTSSSTLAPKKSTPAPSGSLSGKKKRVIHSDTEEDEPPAAPAAAPASSAPSSSKKGLKAEPTSSMVRADDQKAMEAMMSMDMDMDMDVDVNASGVVQKPSPQNKKKPTKKAATAADEAVVKQEPGTTNGSGTRKKRKVKKTVVETNKKGYTVSRDVWTEESCSESESEQNAMDKKPDISKLSKPGMKARDSASSIGSAGAGAGAGGAKKAGGASLKGQSTLKGFFTKK
ncbi:hypothetical protein IAU59_004061 [Kwoniella sp. CBS 9459]